MSLRGQCITGASKPGGEGRKQAGDEVVLVGQGGALSRDLFAFAATLNTSVTALHFAFIRNLPKTLQE